jgi:outer membrane protein assembly factor BamB
MMNPDLRAVLIFFSLALFALSLSACAPRRAEMSESLPELTLVADWDALSPVTAPPILTRWKDKILLLVASTEGTLSAREVPGGAVLWSVDTGVSFEAPPLVLSDRVYAASLEGTLFAIDIETGKVIARASGLGQIKGGLAADPSGKALYAGSYDNCLYRISVPELTVTWRFKAENYINGRPSVLSDGNVAFGSCDGNLYLVDPVSSRELARVAASSYIPSTPASGPGNVVFFAGYEGDLTAWSFRSGTRWKAADESFGPATAPAVYSRDRVFIADQKGKILAFASGTGKRQWSFEAGTAIEFEMIPTLGALIVASSGGTLFMLKPDTGEELFSCAIGGTPSLGGALLDSWFAVGTSSGRVLLFRADLGKERK